MKRPRYALLLVAAASFVAARATAQNAVPRGDADCSVTVTAADVVTSISTLAGAGPCDNDDCDRDGAVTRADVECTLLCIFDRCPIPDGAPRVTSVVSESANGIAPFSSVRVVGTGFGAVDDPKFVTIGGLTAGVIEVVDAETLIVLVPPLISGPSELVVNTRGVDGIPFPLAIAEAAPVGQPDTFDDVLALTGVAVDRFAELPLDLVYGEETALIREQLEQLLANLAARRADLESDPDFTLEARALLDDIFDSSGAAEELRGLIADIEAILAGGEGGGAQAAPAVVAAKALQKAATLRKIATVAAAAATLAGAPVTIPGLLAGIAVHLAQIGFDLALSAGLVRLTFIANNPPLITNIEFTDANLMRRPYATAGGTARIEGAHLGPSGTGVFANTSRGQLRVDFEARDGALIGRLPDTFGFCGDVSLQVARTGFNISSNAVSALVQPELLDLSVDRARVGQAVPIEVRGVHGCTAQANLRLAASDSFEGAASIVNTATRSARFTVPPGLTTPERYSFRLFVGLLASLERRQLEIAPELTGVSINCGASEIQLAPGSPSSTFCECRTIPGTADVGDDQISFASRDASLTVVPQSDDEAFLADVSAKVPSENAAVTCKATFVNRRSLASAPFPIKVVDRTSPSVTLSAPPAEIDPGASVDFSAMASDNDFVTRIVLRATGEAVANPEQQEPCIELESECAKSFTVQTKESGFTQRQVTVRAEAFDGSGNMGTSAERTFTVRRSTPDDQAPVVAIQRPQNGGRVRPGDMVQVSVRLTDEGRNDSGVERVRVEATGPAVASGIVPLELALPRPVKVVTRAGSFNVRTASELDSITDRTITIRATGFDAAGNMAMDTVTVTAGLAPVINSIFPSPAIAGEIIRIAGDGFGEEQGSSTVRVGGALSGLSSWSNAQVLALLPENASGRVSVVIFVDGAASNPFPLTILGSGDVRITLLWEDTNDLDLAVVDPGGEKIDFNKRFSESGGLLDVDANAGCQSETSSPRENVFWLPDGAPSGPYTVTVTYFRACTDPPVASSFTVNVIVDGRFMTLMEGSIGGGSQSESFSRTAGN